MSRLPGPGPLAVDAKPHSKNSIDLKKNLVRHNEGHRLEHLGWLRAAVLGANDGIVSTTSLVLGVAGANVSHHDILLTCVAGLVAGAMSMATGEYVSVSSQSDSEAAALDVERAELRDDFGSEEKELTGIYVHRGLEPALAATVAQQLMAHDALGAHARDELGISQVSAARPLQAAMVSAASFAGGAALPLVMIALVSGPWLPLAVAVGALVALALLGGLAAWIGGARSTTSIVRIVFWSALAMAVTYAVGRSFGTHV